MKSETSVGCAAVITVLAISAIIGGFCWTYTINTWLEFLDKPARIVFWQGALIGFVPYLGQISIATAVLTWLLMMFIA